MTQCTRFSKAWARPVGDTARLVRDISMCRSWQPWLRATLLVLACTPTAVAVALALLLSRPGPVEPDAVRRTTSRTPRSRLANIYGVRCRGRNNRSEDHVQDSSTRTSRLITTQHHSHAVSNSR